jgi:hypothetical protein
MDPNPDPDPGEQNDPQKYKKLEIPCFEFLKPRFRFQRSFKKGRLFRPLNPSHRPNMRCAK